MKKKVKKNKKLQIFIEFVVCTIIIFSVFGLRSTYGKIFLKENLKNEVVKENSENNENNDNNKNNNNSEQQKQETKKEILSPTQKTTELDNIINEYKKDNNKISVIYKDMKSDYRYTFNEEEYFPAASTTKVIYALFIYDKIESGQLSEDTMVDYNAKYLTAGGGEVTNSPKKNKYSIDELIMNMLKYSDNTATAMLIGNNTNATHVLEYYFDKLNIQYEKANIEKNKVTANIMEKVWNYLYDNQNKYTKIIEYLKESKNNEWIKDGISDKIIASKYGAINNVANNTAIVYDDKGDYILIIYTESVINSGDTIAKIAEKINKLHNDNKE